MGRYNLFKPAHDSGIATNILTPYGGPNNNLRLLDDLQKQTGLRGNSTYKLKYNLKDAVPPNKVGDTPSALPRPTEIQAEPGKAGPLDSPSTRVDATRASFEPGKTMAQLDKPSVKIDGHDLAAGKTYVIGRTSSSGKADILVDNPRVSRSHASIRVDADGNKFITDLNSSNGTFVNGKKLAANVETKLGTFDKVSLGPHDLVISEPPLKVKVGTSNLDLKPGQEMELGRGKDGIRNPEVSSHHARLGRDQNGSYYLVDDSRNGTFVTRDGKDIQLKRGEKFELKQGDQVGLGNPVSRGGELLKLGRDIVPEIPTLKAVTGGIGPKALEQSNDYGRLHEIKDRIEDGWSNAGQGAKFNADGSDNVRGRPAIVVDRANDPVLRAALDEAKARFGSLPPRERGCSTDKMGREEALPIRNVWRRS